MKLKILFILLFSSCSLFVFGQAPTIISGTIVDENGHPVSGAMLHYIGDTSYTDNMGHFKIAYPNTKMEYYLYIDKQEFLPKSISIDLSNKDILIDTAIVLRSRKGFWYDSKLIDSTDIGMTIRQAIIKYKLDINDLHIIEEPPGVINGVRTELGDSSYIYLNVKHFFGGWAIYNYDMKNLLDSTIISIGIADTKGNTIRYTKGKIRRYGHGVFVLFGPSNPYYEESLLKAEKEEKKQK